MDRGELSNVSYVALFQSQIMRAARAAKYIVSAISLLRRFADSDANGNRMSANTSASPWTPNPTGL